MKVKELKKILEGIRDDVHVYIKHLGCGRNVKANDWELTGDTIEGHSEWNVFVLHRKDEHEERCNIKEK